MTQTCVLRCNAIASAFAITALLACFVLLGAPRAFAQNAPPCEASPEVKAALRTLPVTEPPNETDYEFQQARRNAIQALRRRYPGNFFIERKYAGEMQGSEADTLKVIAEYKALYEQHPDDPAITFVYADMLVGRDTPLAIKILKAALEKWPNFPWPHNELAFIYTTPNFLDREQAIKNATAFLAACPESFDGYSLLGSLGDPALIGKSALQLRKIIQTRSDPDALGAYQTLWSLEFKAAPPSEYPALRKQVAADVARIRALDAESVRRWWEALQDGYKLIADQKQADWAELEEARRFPWPSSIPAATQWFKDHPYPNQDAPKAERKAYARELLRQTGAWIEDWPNSAMVWGYRMDALSTLDDTPAAEWEANFEKQLQVAQANAGPQPLNSGQYFDFAGSLARKKLEPAQEVEFAQKGLAQFAEENKAPPYDLYAAKKDLEDAGFYRVCQRADGFYYEADGYTRLHQDDKARAALTSMEQELQALHSQINGKDDRRGGYYREDSSYWEAMARLAESENRKMDAMAYYESALLARLDSGNVPQPGGNDDLGDEARQLWATLGGSEDGWNVWYGRPATELASQTHLDWEDSQEPLPAFKLTDLQGKTWQPADLKGKVVFLNFWASW